MISTQLCFLTLRIPRSESCFHFSSISKQINPALSLHPVFITDKQIMGLRFILRINAFQATAYSADLSRGVEGASRCGHAGVSQWSRGLRVLGFCSLRPPPPGNNGTIIWTSPPPVIFSLQWTCHHVPLFLQRLYLVPIVHFFFFLSSTFLLSHSLHMWGNKSFFSTLCRLWIGNHTLCRTAVQLEREIKIA